MKSVAKVVDATSSERFSCYNYYPNMGIGKVWIYRLLFACFCLFVRLRISPPRIMLAASYFARRFIGVNSRESVVLGNFVLPEAPPVPQNRTNRQYVCSLATTRMACTLRKSDHKPSRRPARVASALADSSSALATRMVGMCGYASVPEDGRTCCAYSPLCWLLLLSVGESRDRFARDIGSSM